MLTRWGLDFYYFVYTISNRLVFKIYRLLIANNNYRSIRGVGGLLTPIKKEKIKLKIKVSNKYRLLILDNILYILDLLINLIF